MYQVTAVYQDAEIGYGEGESLSWAIQDCFDSAESFYRPVMDDWEIRCIGGRFPVTMDAHSALTIAKSC